MFWQVSRSEEIVKEKLKVPISQIILIFTMFSCKFTLLQYLKYCKYDRKKVAPNIF